MKVCFKKLVSVILALGLLCGICGVSAFSAGAEAEYTGEPVQFYIDATEFVKDIQSTVTVGIVSDAAKVCSGKFTLDYSQNWLYIMDITPVYDSVVDYSFNDNSKSGELEVAFDFPEAVPAGKTPLFEIDFLVDDDEPDTTDGDLSQFYSIFMYIKDYSLADSKSNALGVAVPESYSFFVSQESRPDQSDDNPLPLQVGTYVLGTEGWFVKSEQGEFVIIVDSDEERVYSGRIVITFDTRVISRESITVNTEVLDDYYDAYEFDCADNEIVFEFCNSNKPLPLGYTNLVTVVFNVLDSTADEAVLQTRQAVLSDAEGNSVENCAPSELKIELKEPERKILMGDCDFSGDVTIKDATLIQKYLAGFEVDFDEYAYIAADVIEGDVNIRDVTAIQKYLANYTVDAKINVYL